jgi:hypothetical protein
LFVGRNGGHLTPAAFPKFAQRQALFNTVEAIKSYELEKYTVSLLVKIIEENGWASDIDLVKGGHINLLFTEKEARNKREDFDMARQAQLNLDGVEWLSKEEVEEVLVLASHLSSLIQPAHYQDSASQGIMSGRLNSSQSCTSLLKHTLGNTPPSACTLERR